MTTTRAPSNFKGYLIYDSSTRKFSFYTDRTSMIGNHTFTFEIFNALPVDQGTTIKTFTIIVSENKPATFLGIASLQFNPVFKSAIMKEGEIKNYRLPKPTFANYTYEIDYGNATNISIHNSAFIQFQPKKGD